MNSKSAERVAWGCPRWADAFPYVNGGLFSGGVDVPRFSRIARSYLLHIGGLDWTKINPDIFGSMIQAVADDEERGALGMHCTSVPNILKVLNPLFLDDLREKLAEAADNARTLLNLLKRLSRIRVFDPACGSGNFLVIAYKEMRGIEAVINQRRGEPDRRSEIPLTNFRGIEIRDFACEIARLALIIAEYQCDVLYRGQKEALKEFLPLDAENWITCGNALRIDWLSVCPPAGTGTKIWSDDMFGSPLDQAKVDFENEGGETYICGNPPYRGSTWQTEEQKSELKAIFGGYTSRWKSLDYVAAWFLKAAEYGSSAGASCAFVATNSICQEQQVPIIWPIIFDLGHTIAFAHTSFKWANLASHKAGVTVVIVGISNTTENGRWLFDPSENDGASVREVANINGYLVPGPSLNLQKRNQPDSMLTAMDRGSGPVDGGHLLLTHSELIEINLPDAVATKLLRPFYGSDEFINGRSRYCLWIDETQREYATSYAEIRRRIEAVAAFRSQSGKAQTRNDAGVPYRFSEPRHRTSDATIVVPRVSSENRAYLPVGLISGGAIVGDRNFALYDAPLWNMAVIASRLHWVWIGTVCVRLEMRFSYSNTLGWNTFPVPPLTDNQKAALTRCAEDILLAREGHFPATIADLYDPDAMPANLREAHERNDETLERIYIGRRFKNDTERLEKLFEMYAKMSGKSKTSS